MDEKEKTAQEEHEERIRIGFPFFEKFFNMSRADLFSHLTDLCTSVAFHDIETIDVHKSLINDVPNHIYIKYHGMSIFITPEGINIQEDGNTSLCVVKFNKYFTLGDLIEWL